MDNSFGFIMTRHVNSETTNRYWNHNVQLLSFWYPRSLIVIIDDNSNAAFVKADMEYTNVKVIVSEYPGRGELLPFIYFYREKWFERAVIIHDSVFFHTRIPFERIGLKKAIPLWFFPSEHNQTHQENNVRIMRFLPYSKILSRVLLQDKQWKGCFGVQCYIQHSFVVHLMRRYQLFRLLTIVKNREDRCSLERIMGVLFFMEKINPSVSLFGNIFENPFGLTYSQYMEQKKKRRIYKVFSGR
jgi:hypothetical protein